MEIKYAKASTDTELKQIITLQKKNAITSVSDKEKEKEGFVTVSHTLDVLKQMNAICPHIIAKYNGEVVGYALSMEIRFGEEIPVLNPMFSELKRMGIQNYLVMGQVCVDKGFRKKGIFRALYTTMKNEYKSTYDNIVTEVDTKNTRSLNAHYAIGFKLLHNYESLGQHWKIICLSTA